MRCKESPFKDACLRICKDLNLDYKLFMDSIYEDTLGAYPDKLASGSVWGVEGQILYALTRILKPNTIVEIGTYFGCSTEYFLYALDKNSKGSIYTVDIAEIDVFNGLEFEIDPIEENRPGILEPLNKLSPEICRLNVNFNESDMTTSEMIKYLINYQKDFIIVIEKVIIPSNKSKLKIINNQLSSLISNIQKMNSNKEGIIIIVNELLDYITDNVRKFFKRKLNPRIIPVQSDGVAFVKSIDFVIDFIFEDGPHTMEFTQGVIENCLPHLSHNGVIVVHDVCADFCG